MRQSKRPLASLPQFIPRYWPRIATSGSTRVLSRFLATMLFGVQPLDAVTFGAVGMVLVLTAALSIAGPAWRGTRVDPLVAMRTQ